jgi:hypothetical protein
LGIETAVYDLIERTAFDSFGAKVAAYVEEYEKRSAANKVKEEETGAMCRNARAVRDSYLKSINYIESLNSRVAMADAMKGTIEGHAMSGLMAGSFTPEFQKGGRYSFSGTVRGSAGNGVIVDIGNFNIFAYTKDSYYDGQSFKTDGFFYEYVDNFAYTNTRGGKTTIPAFKRTQYSERDIPSLDPQCK